MCAICPGGTRNPEDMILCFALIKFACCRFALSPAVGAISVTIALRKTETARDDGDQPRWLLFKLLAGHAFCARVAAVLSRDARGRSLRKSPMCITAGAACTPSLLYRKRLGAQCAPTTGKVCVILDESGAFGGLVPRPTVLAQGRAHVKATTALEHCGCGRETFGDIVRAGAAAA